MSKYSKLWGGSKFTDAEKNTPWFKIMQWLGEKQDVLDVGCSSGYFGQKLIQAFDDRVWGIELDAGDAKKARKLGYQKVFEGDLDSFDWSQLHGLLFDSILFVDVLEHVKEPLAVLKAAQKFLKPGGFVYVSIPNVAHISVRIELLEGNFDYEDTGLLDHTHLRFFTAKTVLKLFHDAGMEVVHRDARLDDVSDGHVRAHMRKLGLQPTDKFNDLLHSTEARTFQHIIGARMASKKSTPPEVSLATKLPDEWRYIVKTMTTNEAKIIHLETETANLKDYNNQLEDQLRRIRSNPALWAAKGALNRIKKYVKNLKK